MKIRTTLATLAAASLTLTACSSASQETANDGTLSLVASTATWALLADEVVDPETVDTESIIADRSVDPHHFEPSATDIAKARAADIVLANGGGYDAWLYDSLEEGATVIHPLPLTEHDHEHEHGGEHDHGHSHDHGHGEIVNEHIWYDPDTAQDIARQIESTVTEKGGAADAAAIVEKLEKIKERLAALPALRVAQTHTIADYLVSASSMVESTPDAYREQSLKEAEPTAASIAAFLAAIEAGEIDVLIDNSQTATDVTKKIADAARAKGIPVVDITETPQEGVSYTEFLGQAVSSFEAVAARD
ncbi:metal ABC transporter solute-binding protein, Zn/Mn family [Corynebacterium renale]|uniref:metal ABC transporter solute-binding protein, Zn/Mn family n=1 Tax=Corynebacterium renale TaxID=1724 RepID=UPI00065364D3|nr:zinc ABC transporter substrate-binding protein [Corynebacterium renale]STC99167.1 ABC-type transporter, periplasmic component [Corynebacterium renale]